MYVDAARGTGSLSSIGKNWIGLQRCVFTIEFDVIMSAKASQIAGVSVVYSTVCSVADLREYESSASLAFVRRIHQWPVHNGPATRKMFSFDDVIMLWVKNHYPHEWLPSMKWVTASHPWHMLYWPYVYRWHRLIMWTTNWIRNRSYHSTINIEF